MPVGHRRRVIQRVPELAQQLELLVFGKLPNGCSELRACHAVKLYHALRFFAPHPAHAAVRRGWASATTSCSCTTKTTAYGKRGMSARRAHIEPIRRERSGASATLGLHLIDPVEKVASQNLPLDIFIPERSGEQLLACLVLNDHADRWRRSASFVSI